MKKKQVRLFVCLLAICACIAAFAAVQVFRELRVYTSAQDEYAALRQARAAELDEPGAQDDAYAPEDRAADPEKATATINRAPEASAVPTESTTDAASEEEYYPDLRFASQAPVKAEPERKSEEAASAVEDLSSINPDYVGWIMIPGTEIDYPVVQGTDNDKYLYTTFEGNANRLGTPFIDVRSTDGFDSPHIILYGHNARDGSMFSPLTLFLDADYRTAHPEILITRPDGTQERYMIVSVRATNVKDASYRWQFEEDNAFSAFASSLGAPEETEHILTLSTCIGAVGGDERLLVHAIRMEG